MKVHVFDTDPRMDLDPTYLSNMGSFGVVAHSLNKALKTIGHYAEPDDADFVGISDGLNLGWKYKDKPAFIINVWDVINSLSHIQLYLWDKHRPQMFGLSNQVTNLWRKHGVPCATVHGACDTDFWKPTIPKGPKFTFLSVNYSNVRSGFDLMIRAFDVAFRGNKDVCLIIKNTSDNPRVAEVIAQFKANGNNLVYLNGRMTFEQIRDLYSSSDCLLNIVRHSSLGLPALEASACGCYSVVGDFCPSNDLIKSSYGALLHPSGPINIKDKISELVNFWGLTDCYQNLNHPEPPQFYDYDVVEYAALLRHIYYNLETTSIDTRTPIVNNFRWEDSARKLVECLENPPD